MLFVQWIQKRMIWFGLSGLIILMGFGLMGIRAVQGHSILNFGSDFAGGTTLVLRFDWLTEKYKQLGHDSDALDQQSSKFIGDVRDTLAKFGLSNAMIQVSSDQDVIIKASLMNSDKSLQVREALTQRFGPIEVLEIDFVGPSMGAEMRSQAILIIAVVSLALMGYITWRFEFAYGVGALIATLHDALIMIAIASIFGMEIDTVFVAAVLTILGYSINDTIVIFDRIRENVKQVKRSAGSFDIMQIAAESVRETFGRTINTVATVVIVLLSLIVFGGATLRPFCVILLIGTLAGTYSSIFIASASMAVAYRRRQSKP